MAFLPKGLTEVALGSKGPFIFGRDLALSKFSVPIDSLDTHIYVVGRSGKGKSKFLEGLLWQLITQGQGCGLIDPHGDLANNVLKLLAFQPTDSTGKPWLDLAQNAAKLVYCEPGRGDYYMPMNVLSGHTRPYTIATNVIEAFQRTWSETLAAAPQFKNIALHSLLLLVEMEHTLAELPWVLMDSEFRNSLLERSQNDDVIAFFQLRYDQWGKEQALRIESILNKVTALTLNDSLRLMLGDSENRLDLRRMMDEGTVLLVNLGTCDHETRDLLGSLLTVALEQAAMSRLSIKDDERTTWFCVLDEFQRFVANEGSAQVLAQMLSEVRKMGLRLALAHQGWHQLNNPRLEGALDQAQVKVIFGSGAKTARVVAEELFIPNPHKIKHEVSDPQAQERTHPHFESLLEQKELFVERIRTQEQRQILVLPPGGKDVIALRTLDVPNPHVTHERIEEVKETLLAQTGKRVTDASARRSSAAVSQNMLRQPAEEVSLYGW